MFTIASSRVYSMIFAFSLETRLWFARKQKPKRTIETTNQKKMMVNHDFEFRFVLMVNLARGEKKPAKKRKREFPHETVKEGNTIMCWNLVALNGYTKKAVSRAFYL